MEMESLRHNQETSTGQVQSLHKESEPTLDTGERLAHANQVVWDSRSEFEMQFLTVKLRRQCVHGE